MVPRAAGEGHDHGACVERALAAAEGVAAARGVRLTSLRRRVLRLVWGGHAPVGAYALLDRLREEGVKAAPPTVYRALAFLLANGLVHRVESRNAYVGCVRPGAPHGAAVLLCRACGEAAELEGRRIARALAAGARGAGFRVERETVEAVGLCARCAEGAAEAAEESRAG